MEIIFNTQLILPVYIPLYTLFDTMYLVLCVFAIPIYCTICAAIYHSASYTFVFLFGQSARGAPCLTLCIGQTRIDRAVLFEKRGVVLMSRLAVARRYPLAAVTEYTCLRVKICAQSR
jgi:hypothetical protein